MATGIVNLSRGESARQAAHTALTRIVIYGGLTVFVSFLLVRLFPARAYVSAHRRRALSRWDEDERISLSLSFSPASLCSPQTENARTTQHKSRRCSQTSRARRESSDFKTCRASRSERVGAAKREERRKLSRRRETAGSSL